MVRIKDPRELEVEELRQLGLDIAPVVHELINPVYAAYLFSIYRSINKKWPTRKGLYAGSGADLSSFLLSTNADEGYFVDISEFEPEEFMVSLDEWDTIETTDLAAKYKYEKYDWSFGVSAEPEDDDNYPHAAEKFVLELKLLGVPQESIELETLSDGQKVYKLSFDWAYPYEDVKKREIYLIHGNITDPENITHPRSFSPTLAQLLGVPYHPRAMDRFRKNRMPFLERQYFDFYFQKAGYYIARDYRTFMNQVIIPSLVDHGLLITDDHYRNDLYQEVFYVARSTFLDTPRELIGVDTITHHHTTDMITLEKILSEQEEKEIREYTYAREGVVGYGKVLTVREIIKEKSDRVVLIAA
ncbi:hypothetical protein ACFL3D_02915 [Candidatus Omnitrophota bacterium]